MFSLPSNFAFDVEVIWDVEIVSDSEDESTADQRAAQPLCAATRDAIKRVDDITALPPEGVSAEALCDAFKTAAIALDLRDPQTYDECYAPSSVPAAMESVGGAAETFQLVRRRAVEWGDRLLRELNADDPQSDCEGSLAARAASAEALYSEICRYPLALRRALPMLFMASIVDPTVDSKSAGGQRVLRLCQALPTESRPGLTVLLDAFGNRGVDGRPLYPGLPQYEDTSWRVIKNKRMGLLPRDMHDKLGLEQLG